MATLDTPPLRVSRPVAACSRCRSAKVKCDGKLPACSACERAGKVDECSSTSDEFAKGKERNYVATLEMRIEKLDAQIKAIREEKERSKSSSAMVELDATGQSQTQPSARRGVGAPLRKKEASDIDELVSNFGYLAVNSAARDEYGFSTSVSYNRIILAACSKEPIPINAKKELPPRFTAQILVQHFLTNIFVLYPLFEETSLYAAIDAVYDHQPWKAAPNDCWVVRMVLAIASASRSRKHGDAEYQDAVGYVSAALDDAEYVLRPGSVASIQSMLLFVLYSILDPYHFDSWTILGAASRLAVDLGLHHHTRKGSGMSKAKLATRKRVFWCLYSLDRSISIAHDRAFSFSDESYTIANVKPIEAEKLVALNMERRQKQDQSGPMEMQPGLVLFMQPIMPAIALFEFRKLQSKFYTDLFQTGRTAWDDPYPYVTAALQSLRRWWDGLSTSTPQVCKDFLELEMLYSTAYILGPSSRMPYPGSYTQLFAFDYAVSYGVKMFRLLSPATVDPARPLVLSSLDMMKTYKIAKQLLDLLRSNEETVLFAAKPLGNSEPPRNAIPPMIQLTAQEAYLTGREAAGPLNAGRAISCIRMFDDILGWLGERWGSMDWQEQFRSDAEPVLDRLYSWFGGPPRTPITPSIATNYTPSPTPSSSNTALSVHQV